MSKPKLFIWSDSPNLHTGFGIVAKNLYRDLHQHFEVFILGINHYGLEGYDTSKYFIYPTTEDDQLGIKRFDRVLKNVKPDIIFLFQDIFNIQQVVPYIKKSFPKVPILAYFPIDAATVSPYWSPGFDTPDKLITYTQFAVDSIHECLPHLRAKGIEYLYHGVDTQVFKKLPSDIRKRIKKEAKWEDKFIIVSNNRFQPRKNIGATVRAYALFAKGYKTCKCGNVYLSSKSKCDLNGCGEEDIVSETLGHNDTFLYLHCNVFEGSMGGGPASSLGGILLNAGFTNEDIPRYVGMYSRQVYEHAYTDAEMNEMYNAADVNISTSLGEGVGLSLIEALATGTTSIAPNHSAIPEMLGDTGHIIKNVAFHTIGKDNSNTRPLVDVGGVVKALETEYQKWVANGKKKLINEKAIERVNTMFLWDDKRDKLTKWLKDLC